MGAGLQTVREPLIFRSLSLQDFRCFELARLGLDGSPHFFLGGNGQGKTALLEALHLVTALRSFRTAERSALIRWNRPEARLLLGVERAGEPVREVEIRLRPGAVEVILEGRRLSRLAELVGLFPTVAFCSQDLQLLRGGPALRRRFLDLTLSAADPAYLEWLRAYHQALDRRNRLLKEQGSDAALEAFEHPLAEAAAHLREMRRQGVAALAAHLGRAYRAISDRDEEPGLALAADHPAATAEQWRQIWRERRSRERILQSTDRGPHRDDLELSLFGQPAREYASEGQQRALVLALRLAQAGLLQDRSGTPPAILADDILGELDPVRRRRFWSALPAGAAVVASGTVRPAPDQPWVLWQVEAGRVVRADA